MNIDLNTAVKAVWGYNAKLNCHEPLPVTKENVYNMLSRSDKGIVYLTCDGLLYLTCDLGFNDDTKIGERELALFSNNLPSCNAIIHYSHGGYFGFCQVNSLETAIADAKKAFPMLPPNASISFPRDGKPYFESNNLVHLQLGR